MNTNINTNSREPLRWYQVPVLWVCAGIFIVTLFACAHLIVLSLEKAAVLPSENHRANAVLRDTELNAADTKSDDQPPNAETVKP